MTSLKDKLREEELVLTQVIAEFERLHDEAGNGEYSYFIKGGYGGEILHELLRDLRSVAKILPS